MNERRRLGRWLQCGALCGAVSIGCAIASGGAVAANPGAAKGASIADDELKKIYRIADKCRIRRWTVGKQNVQVWKEKELGNFACFNGGIYLSSWREFSRVRRSRSIRYLVIDSHGGSSKHAIKIAEWLEKNNVTLVVNRECISSCANYIFLAHVRKVVLAESVVAWHGVPSGTYTLQEYRKYVPKATLSDVKRYNGAIQRSNSFFRDRGVSTDLAGQPPVYGPVRTETALRFVEFKKRVRLARNTGRVRMVWSYDRDTLENYFNIRGIHYYWMPGNVSDFYLRWDAFNNSLLFYGDRDSAPRIK